MRLSAWLHDDNIVDGRSDTPDECRHRVPSGASESMRHTNMALRTPCSPSPPPPHSFSLFSHLLFAARWLLDVALSLWTAKLPSRLQG